MQVLILALAAGAILTRHVEASVEAGHGPGTSTEHLHQPLVLDLGVFGVDQDIGVFREAEVATDIVPGCADNDAVVASIAIRRNLLGLAVRVDIVHLRVTWETPMNVHIFRWQTEDDHRDAVGLEFTGLSNQCSDLINVTWLADDMIVWILGKSSGSLRMAWEVEDVAAGVDITDQRSTIGGIDAAAEDRFVWITTELPESIDLLGGLVEANLLLHETVDRLINHIQGSLVHVIVKFVLRNEGRRLLPHKGRVAELLHLVLEMRSWQHHDDLPGLLFVHQVPGEHEEDEGLAVSRW